MASKTFLDVGALGLYTETPLHCGSEGGTGYVDLPIQRERHTRYPVIPGSTIKGVLRDELKPDLNGSLEAIFGTEDAKGPGAVSFGDGIIALFPVRSSHAPFHWVTCPFVLERVFRLLGKKVEVPAPPGVRQAWSRTAGDVLLEELRVVKKPHPAFFADKDSGLSVLLGLLPDSDRGFEYTRKILRDYLLILSDEDFKELIETATEVVTRIKLNVFGTTRTISQEDDPDEKLSAFDRQGNLFVQEVLPPEALFVAALRAEDKWAKSLQGAIGKHPVLRLGGDETIGRGVTHVTFVSRRS